MISTYKILVGKPEDIIQKTQAETGG